MLYGYLCACIHKDAISDKSPIYAKIHHWHVTEILTFNYTTSRDIRLPWSLTHTIRKTKHQMWCMLLKGIPIQTTKTLGPNLPTMLPIYTSKFKNSSLSDNSKEMLSMILHKLQTNKNILATSLVDLMTHHVFACMYPLPGRVFWEKSSILK